MAVTLTLFLRLYNPRGWIITPPVHELQGRHPSVRVELGEPRK
jgi:hypothetical protein